MTQHEFDNICYDYSVISEELRIYKRIVNTMGHRFGWFTLIQRKITILKFWIRESVEPDEIPVPKYLKEKIAIICEEEISKLEKQREELLERIKFTRLTNFN